jgi:alanine-glyoxylate transaminase/serine-glyoxylate transaminase/serine-pyruvate transaminase
VSVSLPESSRLLLGPGPSPISARVAAALGAPPRSHLDPELLALMDDLRARLARAFRAADGAFTFAVSGTGSAGMEGAVANLADSGRRALAIVTGYFGDRLAATLARYGAEVERLNVEWGRAVDPALVAAALGRADRPFDLVAIVHAETSTGVLNDVAEIARLARQHDALTIVDAVTSLGAMPLEAGAWGLDACYSCSQKGLGAPSGLAPLTFSRRALERRVRSRSFYFDLELLEEYWLRRKYHHTISAPLVYALWTALGEVEEEGLEARWARHERVHQTLVRSLERIGLSLFTREGERLWSLNAVAIPEGIDDLPVRKALLESHQIEIGGGLGPLAGRIWRLGLMGSGATEANVSRVAHALNDVLAPQRSAGAPMKELKGRV